MDYEKAFKEAYERASLRFGTNVANELFLEYKESKEERTRRKLIEFFSDWSKTKSHCWGIRVTDIMDWLEKQGEQRPFDYENATIVQKDFAPKEEQKFKFGDWITSDLEDVNEDFRLCKIIGIEDGCYTIQSANGCNGYNFFEIWESDYHLWSIADAKDGDVLQLGEVTAIFKEFIGNGNCKCYCSVCDGEFEIPSQNGADNSYGCHNAIPSTKEQSDTLMKAMTDAGWKFDYEKKELKKIEDEEYNGEDYGIDSLWHAQRILEKTLGSVDGYQTDDGILSHKCAITAVKKFYEQKPTWTEADDEEFEIATNALKGAGQYDSAAWLITLKQRLGG